MTKVPEGYTELELVGFTDKGSYAEGTNYVKNDLVHYKGSIYKCTEDDTLDVLPNDTSCWEVFIPGQSSLESISAVDTEGKLGAKGEEVSAQRLMDELAKEDTLSTDDRTKLNALGTPDGKSIIVEENGVMKVPIDSELSEESLNPLQNKVIAQKIFELNQSIEELNGLLGDKLDVSKIANNLVTTEAGYALDARQGKVLNDNVMRFNNYLPILFKLIPLKYFVNVSGDINKIKINFSGKVYTRRPIGLLIVCGQDGISSPISIAFKGNNEYEEPISVCISGGVEGVTTTGLSIYINTNFGGSWGNIAIVLFGDNKELNITTEYVKI